jgi:hypothetical protein
MHGLDKCPVAGVFNLIILFAIFFNFIIGTILLLIALYRQMGYHFTPNRPGRTLLHFVYIIWLYGYFKGYCEFSFPGEGLTIIDNKLYALESIPNKSEVTYEINSPKGDIPLEEQKNKQQALTKYPFVFWVALYFILWYYCDA